MNESGRRARLILLTAVGAAGLFSVACDSGGTTAPTVPPRTGGGSVVPPHVRPPTQPPVIPKPQPPTTGVTSVADILAGKSGHNVTVVGKTTGRTSDSDEFWFSDGTGTIMMDFPSGNIAPFGVPIKVNGVVSSSEIDVQSWQRL